MSTAIAIVCTGDYWVGAQVLFSMLRKYGGLPDWVDCLAIGLDECDFAQPVPVRADYSWVPVSQKHFPKVADKFFALTLPYNRIILMDADMMCMGDCSYLWSDAIGSLDFYACRDTASMVYYGEVIRNIGLNPSRLFNAGTMLFQLERLNPGFHDRLLRSIQDGLRAYDGGDQGYLNAYFQLVHNGEVGYLPPEYNESFDVNMPTLPNHAKRILHFTGGNANPWKPCLAAKDPRWEWVKRWRKELETAV